MNVENLGNETNVSDTPDTTKLTSEVGAIADFGVYANSLACDTTDER